MVNTRNNCNG
jgi:hypothetical protein